jgi:protein phosphatase 2C family protein 2/3
MKGGIHMETAVISEKGRRFKMEDAYFLDLNFAKKGWVFGGIYDGHSGEFAAKYCSEKLHQKFLKKLTSGLSIEKAFIESYEEISDELKNQDSGTTAVNFLIKDKNAKYQSKGWHGARIFTANVGDSKAIVIGEKEFCQLTVDHRVDNPVERQRIERMGGDIDYPYAYRGFRGLMPTRTIGDQYFKPIGIIATPSVNEYKISEDNFILLAACDGLFDVMRNSEVADFARKIPNPNQLVEILKKEVLENRLGSDNLTIIVLR